MASGYSLWYYRHILYKVPFLFKVCPDGNYHWRWEDFCYCRLNEYIVSSNPEDCWHGSFYEFATGREYPYNIVTRELYTNKRTNDTGRLL